MNKTITTFISLLFGISAFFAVNPVLAFMSSQNYRIPSDSINIGGIDQKSSSYLSKDTIGEIGSDESQSANYKIKSGYQQMAETFISISAPPDITMSQVIPGIGGGAATGSASWTVITDNLAGYTLTARASTAPALKSGGNSFADYTPAQSGTSDFSFSIANNTSEFGFTPEGTDVVQKFLDNGSTCGIGSGNTSDACWYNFATSDVNISNSLFANQPSGTNTTIKVEAMSGSANTQTAGTYTAMIIVTATPN